MKKSTLLFLAGLLGLGGILVGAWKKITHQRYADFTITIGLLFFAIFWIMTLWDVLSRDFESRTQKIIWLLLVLLFPAIGSLIYLAMKKDLTNDTNN